MRPISALQQSATCIAKRIAIQVFSGVPPPRRSGFLARPQVSAVLLRQMGCRKQRSLFHIHYGLTEPKRVRTMKSRSPQTSSNSISKVLHCYRRSPDHNLHFAAAISSPKKEANWFHRQRRRFLPIDTGSFLAEGTADENAPFGFWDPPPVLPERIVSCLLMIEDKRYYQHFGVDFRSLLRALVNNLSGQPRQGASTIAMQVARLQRPGKRTLWRKACEIGTAVWLNRKYGNENVLRHYLKIVPQGNRIHGVAYAARRYFQKPLADLSWAEAAVLASLPRAPGRMNLYHFKGRRKAFERAKLILNLLHENGILDAETVAISQRQLKSLEIPVKESRPYHSYHAILRLQEMINGTTSYTKPIATSLGPSPSGRCG